MAGGESAGGASPVEEAEACRAVASRGGRYRADFSQRATSERGALACSHTSTELDRMMLLPILLVAAAPVAPEAADGVAFPPITNITDPWYAGTVISCPR